jgi:hypothetical protein
MSECTLVECKETESSESENEKLAGENDINRIFNAKGNVHQECLTENTL